MVNILCIGDVVGSVGLQFLRAKLPPLKKVKAIDLVVCNGEMPPTATVSPALR